MTSRMVGGVPPAPPGWYVDPWSGTAGQRWRWWDGVRWTEHVRAGQPTTPDGQQLAGWWARVGATVIDGAILFPVGLVLALPFYLDLFRAYASFVRDGMEAADTAPTTSDQLGLLQDIWLPVVGAALVGILVNLVYTSAFLRWRGATPGKMALGLEVRLRAAPGRLSWATIGRRWIAQNLGSLVAWIPFVGIIGSAYSLMNVLWPLWDDKRQALHDKFARTNVVVRVRGSSTPG